MQQQQEFVTNLPDPNGFMDSLLARLRLRNDAQLARMLRLQPPQISKIRHGKLALTGDAIVRIHEASDLSVGEIKQMAGLPSMRYPSRDEAMQSGNRRLRGAMSA